MPTLLNYLLCASLASVCTGAALAQSADVTQPGDVAPVVPSQPTVYETPMPEPLDAARSAAEKEARHKALMKTHRKRIIETGKNDHAPTPEEYSPELEENSKFRAADFLPEGMQSPPPAATEAIPASAFPAIVGPERAMALPPRVVPAGVMQPRYADEGSPTNSRAQRLHYPAGGRPNVGYPAPPPVGGMPNVSYPAPPVADNRVELSTDIKMETEKAAPPSRPDQYVSKRMRNEPAPGQELSAGQQLAPARPVDMKPYMAELSRKVKAAWTPPSRQERKVVGVNFIVLGNGSVGNLQVTRSSGSASADEAARQAILRAAPFGPLPGGTPKVIDYTFEHTSNLDNPSFQWGIH